MCGYASDRVRHVPGGHNAAIRWVLCRCDRITVVCRICNYSGFATALIATCSRGMRCVCDDPRVAVVGARSPGACCGQKHPVSAQAAVIMT